jgi:phosphoribosylglycinamide formyltransferase-1
MSGLRIAVLVSGGGTNLQSLIDATKEGTLKSTLVCVVSNKEKAYGLERARQNGIPAFFIDPKKEGYNEILLDLLQKQEVDLIVLAGYLKIIDASLVEAYPNKIINIHPSLLPKFGGKGFYGQYVHEAVLAAGEKVTGATVHFVDKDIDTGKIILQESLEVGEDDTPETLQKKVLEQIEHKILVKAIAQMEEERQ